MVLPLDKLRMPKGKRDMNWLAYADRVKQGLDNVWDCAREGFEQWYRVDKDVAK